MPKAIVFLTYSHADVAWKDRVVACLGGHEVRIWDDVDSWLDEDRLKRLERAMKTAEAAVLLVSESFLASPLVREVEIPFLCERRQEGELEIFPVLVGACAWRGVAWLDGLELRSLGGEPLAGGDESRIGVVLQALAGDVSRCLRAPETEPPGSDPPPQGWSQARREERFQQLFQDYYRPIFYFFARQRISPEECRDLTQEAFANAYRGMGDYRSEATYKTWLFKIAKHIWLNKMRELAAAKRQRLEVAIEVDAGEDLAAVDPPDSDSLGPEERLLQAERTSLVRGALAELPPQRRQCLILRLDGLKYREIAELMGISIQSVRSHLFQARAQLRALLGDHFEVDVDAK